MNLGTRFVVALLTSFVLISCNGSPVKKKIHDDVKTENPPDRGNRLQSSGGDYVDKSRTRAAGLSSSSLSVYKKETAVGGITSHVTEGGWDCTGDRPSGSIPAAGQCSFYFPRRPYESRRFSIVGNLDLVGVSSSKNSFEGEAYSPLSIVDMKTGLTTQSLTFNGRFDGWESAYFIDQGGLVRGYSITFGDNPGDSFLNMPLTSSTTQIDVNLLERSPLREAGFSPVFRTTVLASSESETSLYFSCLRLSDSHYGLCYVDDSKGKFKHFLDIDAIFGVNSYYRTSIGGKFLVATVENKIKVISTAAGELIREIDLKSQPMLAGLSLYGFSDDGTQIVLGSDLTLATVDIATGKIIAHRLGGSSSEPLYRLRDIAVLPSEKCAFVTGSDGGNNYINAAFVGLDSGAWIATVGMVDIPHNGVISMDAHDLNADGSLLYIVGGTDRGAEFFRKIKVPKPCQN